MGGKVFIVGAGPGDVGLMTVKGLGCLERADVVVYDFHLNAQVLNYVHHAAEFIYAGKRGGRHTMPQEEINSILVGKAKEGKTVCRLKGGDPFVFGRGGEEAEALSNAGVEFEIVPGISSAIAAPAYAGIPLTHRKYSSSLAVVPGYEDAAKEGSSIDWKRLATGVETLVILMAVKNINELTKRLIDNGRSPDTPVAVIRWGTRADQKTVTGTLDTIGGIMAENEIKPPAVVVVGEVVRLRDSLKWFEQRPLFGHRVLVTREHSGGFERLAELGAEVVEFRTIQTVPPENWDALDGTIRSFQDNSPEKPPYDWLIFTSANGVKYFFSRLIELGVDIRELKGVSICAIGSKTASEVKKFGLRVDMVPGEYSAEGLIKSFSPSGEAGSLKGERFLLPRAEQAREIFPGKVRELGGHIDVPAAYRAVRPSTKGKRMKRFLKEGKVSVATFTSAATFNNFREMMGEAADELLKDVAIAVIGPVTAKAVQKVGLNVEIMPGEATVDAMVEAIIEWARTSSPE